MLKLSVTLLPFFLKQVVFGWPSNSNGQETLRGARNHTDTTSRKLSVSDLCEFRSGPTCPTAWGITQCYICTDFCGPGKTLEYNAEFYGITLGFQYKCTVLNCGWHEDVNCPTMTQFQETMNNHPEEVRSTVCGPACGTDTGPPPATQPPASTPRPTSPPTTTTPFRRSCESESYRCDGNRPNQPGYCSRTVCEDFCGPGNDLVFYEMMNLIHGKKLHFCLITGSECDFPKSIDCDGGTRGVLQRLFNEDPEGTRDRWCSEGCAAATDPPLATERPTMPTTVPTTTASPTQPQTNPPTVPTTKTAIPTPPLTNPSTVPPTTIGPTQITTGSPATVSPSTQQGQSSPPQEPPTSLPLRPEDSSLGNPERGGLFLGVYAVHILMIGYMFIACH